MCIHPLTCLLLDAQLERVEGAGSKTKLTCHSVSQSILYRMVDLEIVDSQLKVTERLTDTFLACFISHSRLGCKLLYVNVTTSRYKGSGRRTGKTRVTSPKDETQL